MQAAAFSAPVSKSSGGRAAGGPALDPTKPDDAANSDGADSFTQALAGSMGVTAGPAPAPPTTTSDATAAAAAKPVTPEPTQIFAIIPPTSAQAAATGPADAASSLQTVPASDLAPTAPPPPAPDLPAAVIDAVAAQAGAPAASPPAQANAGAQAKAALATQSPSAAKPAQGAPVGSTTPVAFSAVSFSVTRTGPAMAAGGATPQPADQAQAPTSADAVPVASMTLTAEQTAAALPTSATAPVKAKTTTAATAKAPAKPDAPEASAETDPAAPAGQPASANPVPPTPPTLADATGHDAKSGSEAPAPAPQAQPASNTVDGASLSALATAPVTPQAAVQAQTSAEAATGAAIVSQIAAQVAKSVDGKSTRFDITLDPAGLGHVNVKVEIGAQGQVTAQLSFDNAHTAAEAKSQAGQLQQALEQAGFNIAQGGLSFDVGGQGGGFAGQDAPAQQSAAASVQAPDPTPNTVAAIAAINATLPALGVDITI
jgi:hypothetical protein